MRHDYHRRVEATCAHCLAPFKPRVAELKRRAGRFCSRACKYAASRGRELTRCVCARCGLEFERFTYLTRRPTKLFCSSDCSVAAVPHEERVERGRRGGLASHRDAAAEVKFARSRAGGLARAARLSRERLVEIGKAGVRARLALPYPVRQAIARKATVTRLGVKLWFGVNVLPDARRRTGTDG